VPVRIGEHVLPRLPAVAPAAEPAMEPAEEPAVAQELTSAAW